MATNHETSRGKPFGTSYVISTSELDYQCEGRQKPPEDRNRAHANGISAKDLRCFGD